MNCKEGRKRGEERRIKSGIINGTVREKIIERIIWGGGVIIFFVFGVQVSGSTQVNTVNRELTTSEIVSNYPNHAPGSGGSINLFGQNYNNALYLEPLGRALYPYWCSGADGRKRNGEYLWDVSVSEWRINTKKYSVLRLEGSCANSSKKINAGALLSVTTVQEEGEARIVEFTASRNKISLGESITLTWKMENMAVFGNTPLSVLAGSGLGNIRVPQVGSMTVTPRVRGPVNYLLMGWGNKEGSLQTIQRTIQVIVE